MAPDERPQAGGTPPEPREPENAQQQRRWALLEERLATLEPSGREDLGAAAPLSSPPPAPGEGFDPEQPPLGADFRQRVVAEFRERQREAPRAAYGEAGAPPGALLEGEPEPPQPPSPPPAVNWLPLGPSVVRDGQAGTQPSTSGRINGIAAAPGGNRVYAATACGGVWRSDDAGASWRSLMDAWDLNPTTQSSDSLSCGAIAIDPTNPDRIFVGSGDGDESLIFGVGPVFSPDGGVNWVTEPVAPGSPSLGGSACYTAAVDPGNPNRVVLGTRLGVYRREPVGGGFHWARKTAPSGFVTGLAVARTGSTTTFYAAPSSGPVFSSTDGGSWTQVGTGFPTSNVGRVGLAVRPTDPSVVYALVASAAGSMLGVWRLDTSSNQWRQVSGAPSDLFGPPGGGQQGTYDLAIAVDPNNANRLYLGGSIKFSGGDWSGCVYRSTVSSSGTGSGLTYSMSNTYIGNSVHGDIHTLAFAPGDPNKLWLGCDGGVYYSTNPTGTGSNVFSERNTGLQALTTNSLAQHPTEDAVVFCGTQDNGCLRYTGEEVWLYSAGGDGGFCVVNWNDPYRVLSGYWGYSIRRSTTGGTRYSYADVNVMPPTGDDVLFYPPILGAPPSATPAQAERVAFGSRRVWISNSFGGGWQSIPSNAAGDDLGERVRSLAFASYDTLYAGTIAGRVYRFERAGTNWTRTRIDNVGGANVLGLAGPVTSIAVDPSDASGNSIFVAFGGTGNFRHVWRFNGSQWAARSGPSAGAATSLLDVQHNALVCDPANPGHVYVGADIGVWRSTDGGQNWSAFSAGLPDAVVLDLDLHPQRLLRAATYGRGAFEYDLAATSAQGVELYVRDTQLDRGRRPTVDYLPDPARQGETVRHWAGPDIKLDTPDAAGNYQFPIAAGTTIDFEQFVDDLSDDFQNVATHATADIVTRVFVQVHNRGVTPANGVQVMLLLANASMALPNLPAGYEADVQAGNPINTPSWRTVGVATLNDVRVGFPRIAAFELHSSMLPPPASLAGNNHHCVLALVHHGSDAFTATETVTDLLSVGERRAAHKNLKVVQFTGTVPPQQPQWVMLPVQIHNPYSSERLLTGLTIDLGGYEGALRVLLPRMELDGDLRELIEGAKLDADLRSFEGWAKRYLDTLDHFGAERAYDEEWTRQRSEDVRAALESRQALRAERGGRIALHRIVMGPESRHTIFLMIERPRSDERDTFWPFELVQHDEERDTVLGGLSGRIEIVPDPEVEVRDPFAGEASAKG